jgi:hypothetical protein
MMRQSLVQEMETEMEMETGDGDQRWRPEMETRNGDQKWRSEMEMEIGDGDGNRDGNGGCPESGQTDRDKGCRGGYEWGRGE